MEKWYNDINMDEHIIISCRCRLARNIKKYPFSIMLKDEGAAAVIKEAAHSIKSERSPLSPYFEYIDVNNLTALEKQALVNKHIISPEFIKTNNKKGLLVKDDESCSIMLNEEDHIRIQTIFSGDNMEKAWDMADKIDNLIEESIEFAFDKDYGYLTSCPTNTGTGLRASYMVHIPLLEKTGQFRNIVQAIGKFGMTARGIYGEGTESMGSIYQISNQVTLGKTEQEIIKSLQGVTHQIIEQENKLREKMIQEKNYIVEDMIYRAYGILSNCRKISGKEAIKLLSDVRLGYMTGILKTRKPKHNIYSIIMNIQPGLLQFNYGKEISDDERDVLRARYIRDKFDYTDYSQ